eukprot:SAG31_NODE_7400_length_1699_cov_2.063125_3_plen_126_part_00
MCGNSLAGGRIKGLQIWPTGVRPAELGQGTRGAAHVAVDDGENPTVKFSTKMSTNDDSVDMGAIGHQNLPASRERDTFANSGLGPNGEDFVKFLRIPVQWERTRTRRNTGAPPVGPSRSSFNMPR